MVRSINRKKLVQVRVTERHTEREKQERGAGTERERQDVRERSDRVLTRQMTGRTREASGGGSEDGMHRGSREGRVVNDRVIVEVPAPPRFLRVEARREGMKGTRGKEEKGKGSRRADGCDFCKSRGQECYKQAGPTNATACWACYKRHISCSITGPKGRRSRKGTGTGRTAGAGIGAGDGGEAVAEVIRKGFAETNGLLLRGVKALEGLLANRGFVGSDIGSGSGSREDDVPEDEDRTMSGGPGKECSNAGGDDEEEA